MASAERLEFDKLAAHRLQGMQARLATTPLPLPAKAEDLHEEVRRVLTLAFRAELLTTGMHQLSRLLSAITTSGERGRHSYAFSCGAIDFGRRLRAHIHASDDDVRLPSAVLHPLEALIYLLLHRVS